MHKKIKPKESGVEKHAINLAAQDVPEEPVAQDAGLGAEVELQPERVAPEDQQPLDATVQGETVPSQFKSFLSKAKEAVTEVTAHAAGAGNLMASKAATLGTTAAAKTSELGKQTLSGSAEMTRSAVKSCKQAYAGSPIESTVNFLDSELEQRGVKQALKETSTAIGGKLDEVTGKRLLELVEQRLQLQDYYNDVLATRLADALERIGRLEAQLAELKTGAPAAAQDPITGRNAESTHQP